MLPLPFVALGERLHIKWAYMGHGYNPLGRLAPLGLPFMGQMALCPCTNCIGVRMAIHQMLFLPHQEPIVKDSPLGAVLILAAEHPVSGPSRTVRHTNDSSNG